MYFFLIFNFFSINPLLPTGQEFKFRVFATSHRCSSRQLGFLRQLNDQNEVIVRYSGWANLIRLLTSDQLSEMLCRGAVNHGDSFEESFRVNGICSWCFGSMQLPLFQGCFDDYKLHYNAVHSKNLIGQQYFLKKDLVIDFFSACF